MKAFKGLTAKLGIFGELLDFLWQRKLWWLIPIIILLVLFGIIMITTSVAFFAI